MVAVLAWLLHGGLILPSQGIGPTQGYPAPSFSDGVRPYLAFDHLEPVDVCFDDP